MSRSYKKVVKQGVCQGSNTKYYKARRRWVRNKNRQILRNSLTNYTIDDVNDLIVFIKLPKRNDWDEPTDGTYLITKADKKFWEDRLYWDRKIGKYLKSKHQ